MGAASRSLPLLVCHDMSLVGAGVAALLADCGDIAVTVVLNADDRPWRNPRWQVLLADYTTGLQSAADRRSHGHGPGLLLVSDRTSPAEVRHAIAAGVLG